LTLDPFLAKQYTFSIHCVVIERVC